MKLRKHRNNKTFRISFTTRSPNRTETHLNSDGSTRKVVIEGVESYGRVFATGSDEPSVLRAFLFGRDATNIRTSIFEAQYVWTGRLVNS